MILKPHPLASSADDAEAVHALAQTDSRLIANVHNVPARSAATVSINSTVALDGCLHRVPALLMYHADFHRIAGIVTKPAQFSQVLAQALTKRGGFAQYLAWYFHGISRATACHCKART